MIKYIVLFLTVMFFVGCETKLENILKQDPEYVKSLQNTQRGNIVNSFETKSIIVATYLKEDENITQFLIGVYNTAEDSSLEEGGLFNKNYDLTLNEESPVKIDLVDDIKLKDMQLSSYPFYQKWIKYYIVDFSKSEKPYNIKYNNNLYGHVELTFK
jgi:hypothetical protein